MYFTGRADIISDSSASKHAHHGGSSAVPRPVEPATRLTGVLALVLASSVLGCDGGLAPPTEEQTGVIEGRITYAGAPDAWDLAGTIQDLRFVAMRFLPQDTSDFLQLNRMAISDGLARDVAVDSFVIPDVEPGVFVYSGVAQQFDRDLLAWRPVGLYEANDGLFEVAPGETTRVEVTVDFANPPPFPP